MKRAKQRRYFVGFMSGSVTMTVSVFAVDQSEAIELADMRLNKGNDWVSFICMAVDVSEE